MGKIKFDLATNFDMEILEHIKRVDKNKQVVSLFGKMKSDIIGGGRSSIALSDVSFDDIAAYNKRCREMGIRFNYLLNPLCLGNKDIVPQEHKKIVEFIGQLNDINIEWVTVCSPYILNLIKKQFPRMKVTIGLYAFINSLQEAKNWIDMQADELTLMQTYTRDFNSLRLMLREFKKYDVNLRILANNGCLHECPFAVNHGAAAAHSSGSNEISANRYFDYSLINCYQRKISQPANVIASDWIRPEDLKYYEELCEETGNDRLVIKLVERTKSTHFLCNAVSAYINEKYEGNLLDLFNWVGNDEATTTFDISGFADSLSKGEIDLQEFIKYSSFFKIPKLYLDNNELNGFIKPFLNNYHCRDKICWMENKDPDVKNENYCYYCYEWAKKAIRFEDVNDRDEWIKNVENLRDSFESSRIFK